MEMIQNNRICAIDLALIRNKTKKELHIINKKIGVVRLSAIF
jgi:hypothetical protein